MKKYSAILLAILLTFACSVSALACTEYCGSLWPFFGSDILSEEELQIEALRRINEDGNNIIGKYAVVVHYGNIRSSAYKYAPSIGKAIRDDEYLILGYQFVEGNAWLQILYGNNPNAWVSASLVEISGKWAEDGNSPYSSAYVGRTCKITVSSGRARMQPSKDAPTIEYVHRGEKYTIIDTAAAPDNTLWFKIMIDGNMCWISSGIASTN